MAVSVAMECKDNLLAILPTSGGKSMIYELALINQAVKRSSHTYAVLCYPINAIKRQNEERFDGSVIEIRNFEKDVVDYITNHQSKTQLCTLIQVHPNSFTDPMFWDMIKRKRPAFVCLDEAHLAIQWKYFIDGYKYFNNFQLYECPVFLLSATAPPSEVPSLMKNLSVHNYKEVRASTNRTNLGIKICVLQDDQSVLENIVLKLKEFIETRKQEERAILNVQTIRDMEVVTDYLQVLDTDLLKYHGKLDEEQQLEAQKKWIEKGPIVVCTQGFGLGVDYPCVTLILHYKSPEDIKQYDQDIGRGGRDGRTCHCQLYTVIEEVQSANANIASEKAMIELLTSAKCRRKVLKTFIDGIGVICQPGLDETCDNCLGNNYSIEGSRSMSQMLEAINDLNDLIDLNVGKSCIMGYIYGKECSHERGKFSECPFIESGECFYCMNGVHEARVCPYKKSRVGYCYKCFLPINSLAGFVTFHRDNYKDKCDSKYSDIIMPYCGYLYKKEKTFLNRKLVPVSSFKEYHDYLMELTCGLPNALWLVLDHWKSKVIINP
jgi:ATP-dependent DNA helicase RecQ